MTPTPLDLSLRVLDAHGAAAVAPPLARPSLRRDGARTAALAVDLVNPRTVTTADLEAWAALSTTTATPNPFFAPEFLLSAMKHLPSSRVRLLVARAGREWIGLLPVVPAMHWKGLPGRILQTWLHAHCFLGAPLLREGAEVEGLAGLLGAAHRRVGMVALDRLPADGRFAAVTDAAYERLGVQPIVWHAFERAAIRRTGTGDYVRQALGAKRYSDIRRRQRLLERDFGELTLVDHAGDAAAVERFLALESAGWKGESGTALAAAEAAGFFRSVCAAFAAQGRLQLLTLSAGDRVVAMESSLIAGDTVFAFKIAYDESVSRYGPGIQLMDAAARHFHQRDGARWFDSCAASENATLNRLLPDRRSLTSTLIPSRSVRGGFARAQARVASALRDRVRR